MKAFITILLLLVSTISFAQNNKADSGANIIKQQPILPAKTETSKPTIPISPSVSTTVINQPPSIPQSNNNPITGTVIGVKASKKPAKPASQEKLANGNNSVVIRTDTTSSKNRSKAKPRKKQ